MTWIISQISSLQCVDIKTNCLLSWCLQCASEALTIRPLGRDLFSSTITARGTTYAIRDSMMSLPGEFSTWWCSNKVILCSASFYSLWLNRVIVNRCFFSLEALQWDTTYPNLSRNAPPVQFCWGGFVFTQASLPGPGPHWWQGCLLLSLWNKPLLHWDVSNQPQLHHAVPRNREKGIWMPPVRRLSVGKLRVCRLLQRHWHRRWEWVVRPDHVFRFTSP